MKNYDIKIIKNKNCTHAFFYELHHIIYNTNIYELIMYTFLDVAPPLIFGFEQ
jgi:hypothetical protein